MTEWPASFWKWGMLPPAIVVSNWVRPVGLTSLHLEHNRPVCKIDEIKLSQKAGRG